jgi:hypothetical protein
MIRVFGSTMLKEIFRSKCNREISCRKKLDNEEIHKLHASPNFIQLNDLG